jgi:thiamine-phosphate pyrophosphorylase
MKMDKKSVDYTLYICTDRGLMSSETVEQSVESVIKGGATVIQLREKNASSGEFYEQAKRVKQITDSYGVPLIINDRVDIALAVNADGVHLGQSDLPCSVARADSADYIGVGAMFATSTKSDAKANTKENLAAIRKVVDIPIVIIGGIKRSNVLEFAGMGVNGAAVISDIIADANPEKAAKEMVLKLHTQF